jgi:hypothetical protein
LFAYLISGCVFHQVLLAYEAGSVVSANVTPPARTESVTHNKTVVIHIESITQKCNSNSFMIPDLREYCQGFNFIIVHWDTGGRGA